MKLRGKTYVVGNVQQRNWELDRLNVLLMGLIILSINAHGVAV
jgi:hypothetical protein